MAQNINVPTVWTKAQSPITVRNLNLYSTLTIEAGVEVRMGDSSAINFWNGSASQLIVNGTTTEPVIFRASTVSPWKGIVTAAVRSTRPTIRVNNASFEGVGSSTVMLDLKNADAYFGGCRFTGPAVVPAGYSQAGQSTVLCAPWGTALPIATFEGCEINGFSAGIKLTQGVAVIDCDFNGVAYPITGRLLGVSALGL